MIFEAELRSYLLTIPAITALVNDRVFGLLREPAADLPAVLVQRALAAVLRALLIDFTGTMGGAYVDRVLLTNEFPLNDPDPGVIRVTQLYNFWYVED